ERLACGPQHAVARVGGQQRFQGGAAVVAVAGGGPQVHQPAQGQGIVGCRFQRGPQPLARLAGASRLQGVEAGRAQERGRGGGRLGQQRRQQVGGLAGAALRGDRLCQQRLHAPRVRDQVDDAAERLLDRKSTRLNSSHVKNS